MKVLLVFIKILCSVLVAKALPLFYWVAQRGFLEGVGPEKEIDKSFRTESEHSTSLVGHISRQI